MLEPLAQFVARSNLFEPEINCGVFFLDAARPEPIHQHAHSIIWPWLVINALDCYCLLAHTYRPCHEMVLSIGEFLRTSPLRNTLPLLKRTFHEKNVSRSMAG